MARDRQRAKQRRRRSDAGPRTRTTRARDIGFDDGTPAPDPLKHSSADVDEALLAEAGATPPDVGEELPDESAGPQGERGAPPVDFDDELASEAGDRLEEPPPGEAPDALEEAPPRQAAPDALEEPAGAVAARPRAPERGAGGNRVVTFLRNSWEELQRVQWPDRRQVGQGTAVTLGFVVVAGGYLGLLDAIWKPLIEAIL